MASTTARKTPARRGRTVAAVDKDVKALRAEVAELQTGIGSIVELLKAQADQKVNDDVQSQVEWTDEPAQVTQEIPVNVREYEDFEDDFEDFDEFEEDDDEDDFEDEPAIDPRDFKATGYARRPRKGRKSKVGQRSGDKIIRNIRPHMARFRLGNPRDPFRVVLEGRGQPGDTDQIPRSLVNDIGYKRNLNKVFEEITEEEYNALQNVYAGYGTGGFDGGYTDAELIYDEDRTVATMVDVADPRRRGFGPRYVDAVGSAVDRHAAMRQATGQEQPEFSQDELVEMEMYRRRQQGLLPPDPSDPMGREAAGRMKRRHAVKAAQRQQQLAGNDRESQIMAQRIAQLERGGRAGQSRQGIIPEGELGKPVTMVQGNIDVVTSPYGLAQGAPSRRLPTENVPQVPQRRGR